MQSTARPAAIVASRAVRAPQAPALAREGCTLARAGLRRPCPPRPPVQGVEGVQCRGDVRCGAAAAGVADLASYYPPKKNGLGKLMAHFRATVFYVFTVALAFPIFAFMLLSHPVQVLFDKYRRRLHHFANDIWAVVSTLPFYRVQVTGREHLPDKDQAVVYVANHQSFMDIYTLFHIARPFKFISKLSIFMIPIVGWSMWLTGHVPLARTDRRSQLKCLKDCQELLEQGCSVLFFPEGTRSADGKMQSFKKGAFSVAAKVGVPVVPITLEGCGPIMPNKREGEMYPGRAKITIHPAIVSKDANELCEKARAAVASALPPMLQG
ncbi:unnamed protein product [Pedinophyceae sp. YPF-701]|nr:unnamed protein product [Pedinophyceae sp. YPF-701]